MSEVYDYGICDSFKYSEVDTSTLEDEINASSISSATLEGEPTVSGDVCSISFDGVLSQEDEDTLDALVANHMPLLPLPAKYKETLYESGTSGDPTWVKLWATKISDDVYEDPVQKTEYTYSEGTLTSIKTTEYWLSGSIRKETTCSCLVTSSNTVVQDL